MSDVLNLLCDYASAGAVVDRNLIAAVGSRLDELSGKAGELRARLAAAEARSTGGTCRILSGECDCTLCKQDAKIAELTRKAGELHSKLAAAEQGERAMFQQLEFTEHRLSKSEAQLAAAEAEIERLRSVVSKLIITSNEWNPFTARLEVRAILFDYDSSARAAGGGNV